MADFFTKDSTDFFKELALNNNKAWFEENRKRYQKSLQEPLKHLAEDLYPAMMTIDHEFKPSVSRINKDIRFSKDKSPYKTALWVSFKKPVKDWQDSPAYFFEITADAYRYGMGFYMASPKTMELFRKKIDDKPKEFLKTVEFLKKQTVFQVEGDFYKKIFRPELSEELKSWYQRKNFYLIASHEIDKTVYSSDLSHKLAESYLMTADCYRFLSSLK